MDASVASREPSTTTAMAARVATARRQGHGNLAASPGSPDDDDDDALVAMSPGSPPLRPADDGGALDVRDPAEASMSNAAELADGPLEANADLPP